MAAAIQRLQAAAWQKQPAAQTHAPVELPSKQAPPAPTTASAAPQAPGRPLVSAHELSMLAKSYLERAALEGAQAVSSVPGRACAPATVQQASAPAFPSPAPAPAAACGKPSQPPGTEATSVPSGASTDSPVDRLWVAMGKDPADDSHCVVMKDVLSNLQLVKSLAPQLLTDFAKIHDGSGKITAEQLKRYMGPRQTEG